MGKKLLFTIVITLSVNAFSDDIMSRCRPDQPGDQFLYFDDFKWGYTLQELMGKFAEIYKSGKRLKSRAYFDSTKKEYLIPVNTLDGVKTAVLSPGFILSVQKHIENSLKNHYADAVIFPDMGHSHFFIPPATMQRLNKIEFPKDKNIFYEELFKAPDVKTLYHTAEQLTLREGERGLGGLVNDEYLHWRYYTRNVVGDNDGSGHVEPIFALNENYNTLRELPGYEYYGAGFNISASQEGCLQYTFEGKTVNYDISLEDLGSKAMPSAISDL